MSSDLLTMNTTSLSRITMETMANYRSAVAQVVAASEAGSRRLVRAVDGAVQDQVVPRTARLAPRAGQRLDGLRGRVSRRVEQGIDQVVELSQQIISRSSDFALAQVTRWNDFAADVDNQALAGGLQTAARLSLPAAQLALVVSGKVAEGAAQLADVAGAKPAKKAARAVRKGSAGVQRRVAKAARVVKAETKPVRRRAAKVVAAVADAKPVQRARRAAKKAVAA
jgi:hypothetical protein